MTDVGLDYAWQSVDLDLAWSQGYRFVSRYLSYDPSKNLTAGELTALLARGFHVAANWEWYGDWAHDYSGGAATGHQHATDAVAQARALGYPTGCTIYFSADFDVTEAQQPTVNAYQAAARDVCHAAGYRAGMYGGYWAIKRAFDAGVIDDGWQTYAWSGGQWDPRAAIRQDQNGIYVGGAQVDHNTRVGQTYLMGQATSTVEDDMAETFVKDGDGNWWFCAGDTRRKVTQRQKDDIAYWHARAGRTVTTCMDDDGQHPKVFVGVDLNIWGVDIATLQGGGGGGPTHDELVDAAFEGAQRAEKE